MNPLYGAAQDLALATANLLSADPEGSRRAQQAADQNRPQYNQ